MTVMCAVHHIPARHCGCDTMEQYRRAQANRKPEPMTDTEAMILEGARIIWGMDQDSVEKPFERLSSFHQSDLLDTAKQVLALAARPTVSGDATRKRQVIMRALEAVTDEMGFDLAGNDFAFVANRIIAAMQEESTIDTVNHE